MDRRAVAVRGIVQGVGFRPFVFHLATRRGLGGVARNPSGELLIEVEGGAADLDAFLEGLLRETPPLARIDDVTWSRRPPRGDTRFVIESSGEDAGGPVLLAADVAPCERCLAELFD